MQIRGIKILDKKISACLKHSFILFDKVSFDSLTARYHHRLPIGAQQTPFSYA